MIGIHIPNKTGIRTFMAGALIGLVMFLVAFFQDTEAIIFSALVSGDATLNVFSCPEIITLKETGQIETQIHNSTDKPQYRSVRADITQGYLTFKREFVDHYTLQPGETKPLSWTIYPEDAAYGYLILAKVYLFPQEPLPSYVGACGVMLLKTNLLTGWQIIGAAWLVSLGLMAVGYRRYIGHNQPLVRRKRALAVNMLVIAGTLILANGTMFLENWYLELLFFIFSIVLMAESVFSFSQN